MDKIMGMFKGKGYDSNPMVKDYEQRLEKGDDLVHDAPAPGYAPQSEVDNWLPKPSAPEVQPTSLFEDMSTRSMGTGTDKMFEELRRKRFGRFAPSAPGHRTIQMGSY